MDEKPGALERLKAALSGRYTIDREIGRGGMATVYLAQDLKHDRPVAIKVLRDEGSLQTAPHRFQREIQVTAGLIHPHILPLLDSDALEGLHYYVMPYVKGESLQERLDREGRIPLDEAVGIACEVADALAHAHRHGLVHRDIKPGNILLEEGHVFLADFGIVRPSGPSEMKLTREGRVIGTPFYQSPEQWTGETRLDGRSDLYSLGCVLFEMLTGEPPFRGPSPEAVAGKHLHERPPPLRVLRPSVPESVDRVVTRTLAKEPGERFETAEVFAEALKTALETGSSSEVGKEAGVQPPVLGRMGVAVGMLALALVLWLGRGFLPGVGGGDAVPPDTTRYWVVAPVGELAPESELDVVQRLSHALERWDEITVGDPVLPDGGDESSEGWPGSDADLASLAQARDIGRLVRVSVGDAGSDFRLNAEILNVEGGGSRLGSASVLVPRDLEEVDSLITLLADRLLFRDDMDLVGQSQPGTRSLAARHAFLEGSRRLAQGDLARADEGFARAVAEDPDYAEASLKVALTRFWRGMDAPQWRAFAEQAAMAPDLSGPDRTQVDAILAQAQGDFPRACELWESVTDEDPGYFGGWLGRGICLETDVLVLPDPRSPSGWSFRTSYNEALGAYRRAFDLFPSLLASFRQGSYSELRSLFLTMANARRRGPNESAGDPVRFVAAPAWQGDTLALVPYPESRPGLQFTVEPRALEMAVHRQRALLHEVILGWASASPDDADANEALAVSLARLGDPQALDVIRRARTLTGRSEEQLRLAGVEAWMELAFAIPEDTEGIVRARVLADSVLSAEDAQDVLEPLFLAALATLTGRADRAAELVRLPGVAEGWGVPPPLRETAAPLLIYAALGGPADSLDALEARVTNGIAEALPPEDRRWARQVWVARAATLAFHEHRMDAVGSLERGEDWLLDLQASFAAGDSVSLRAGLAEVRDLRAGLPSSSVTLDALLSEAELLVGMGRIREAADALDPALRALPQAVPLILTDPVWAAALVRVACLRSVIAFRLDDLDTTNRWLGAVRILWSDADPFLLERMSELDSLLE